MRVILSIVLGYLVGNINPSYIIGKARGFDLKREGSKNAGASNAIILMGKLTGGMCALFDIFKAFFVYKLCVLLFPALEPAGILAGVGCMLGHIFPFWMNFRGGKGLASLGGTILAYDWKFFFMLLAAEILLVLLVGYICIVAISASIIFPAVYAIGGGQMIGVAALLVVTAVMLVKHRENLKRIREGKELRISYLWNKEKEIERLKDKYPDQ